MHDRHIWRFGQCAQMFYRYFLRSQHELCSPRSMKNSWRGILVLSGRDRFVSGATSPMRSLIRDTCSHHKLLPTASAVERVEQIALTRVSCLIHTVSPPRGLCPLAFLSCIHALVLSQPNANPFEIHTSLFQSRYYRRVCNRMRSRHNCWRC